MPYLALSFDLGAMNAEQVENHCFSSGALSVTFSDSRDDAVLEPALGEVRLWPATRVQALYGADSAAAELIPQLAAQLGISVTEIAAAHIADRVWEREWLRDFHAMRFGSRLWVCPHHERVEEPGAVVVHLDPGLAFGTGTHPSTALCLGWLDQQLKPPRKVIDYGCGSGILGIAAAILGALDVQAFDIDPQALTACRDNAASNAVDDRLWLRQRVSDLSGDADLLLANILADTLIELNAALAQLVRPGGNILLAGILAAESDAVTAAYTPWFDIGPVGRRDDWIALAGIRQ